MLQCYLSTPMIKSDRPVTLKHTDPFKPCNAIFLEAVLLFLLRAVMVFISVSSKIFTNAFKLEILRIFLENFQMNL